MFPSSHDITPGNLGPCMTVLAKLLAAGNQVLVVSKPRLECIKTICQAFQDARDQILFRFTIGAMNNEILKFWEPCAPSYEERRESLRYAFEDGFRTSVSIEPMLDSENVFDLVLDLVNKVNHSFWIGKMNHIKHNIVIDSPEIEKEVSRIEEGQTYERLYRMYMIFGDFHLIRYKSCIKRDLGLPPPDGPEMDI
jgi:DNA repair photolyase